MFIITRLFSKYTNQTDMFWRFLELFHEFIYFFIKKT